MLVETRAACESERLSWSSSTVGLFCRNTAPFRMSNFPHPTTQPEWQEQYSTYPSQPTEERHFQPPEHRTRLNTSISEDAHKVQQVIESRRPQEPRLGTHLPAPGTSSLQRTETPANPQVEHRYQAATLQHDASSSTTRQIAHFEGGTSPNAQVKAEGERERGEQKDFTKGREEEEMEEEIEDEEMLEASDDGRPEPRTDAEKAARAAEKKKMKRFRLTHQQTRFLMSEFAKQPHPDAAHRERLSREIPGQSPRQVQVWFQNRRAKLKRMTADDRERMMRMRAVPNDFDNIQALHSPYGATNHGLSTPMHSPVDYQQQPSYGDPAMIRPLGDTIRRQHSSEHLSPTGLSQTFGMVGFGQQHSIGPMGPDILSPLSINSNERYYTTHPSPSSAGPRTANPFTARQTGIDSSYQMQQRPPPQRIVPLQIRETMSRSRSDALRSPLRSSMSWTGESLDYANYQPGQSNSPSSGNRQQYHSEHPRSTPTIMNPFDASSQPDTGLQTVSSQTYPPAPPSTNSETMSRLRASSLAFPPNLEVRTNLHYRPVPAHQTSPLRVPQTARASSFASTFSSGFQSAPLTAPVDFHLPRTPVNLQPEYEAPQMNTPMAGPTEFNAPYNPSSSSRDIPHHDTSFQPQSSHQTAEQGVQSPSFVRPEGGYVTGEKRKRSYTLPGYNNQ